QEGNTKTGIRAISCSYCSLFLFLVPYCLPVLRGFLFLPLFARLACPVGIDTGCLMCQQRFPVFGNRARKTHGQRIGRAGPKTTSVETVARASVPRGYGGVGYRLVRTTAVACHGRAKTGSPAGCRPKGPPPVPSRFERGPGACRSCSG